MTKGRNRLRVRVPISPPGPLFKFIGNITETYGTWSVTLWKSCVQCSVHEDRFQIISAGRGIVIDGCLYLLQKPAAQWLVVAVAWGVRCVGLQKNRVRFVAVVKKWRIRLHGKSSLPSRTWLDRGRRRSEGWWADRKLRFPSSSAQYRVIIIATNTKPQDMLTFSLPHRLPRLIVSNCVQRSISIWKFCCTILIPRLNRVTIKIFFFNYLWAHIVFQMWGWSRIYCRIYDNFRIWHVDVRKISARVNCGNRRWTSPFVLDGN